MNYSLDHKRVEPKWKRADQLELGEAGFIVAADSTRYIGCFAIIVSNSILVYPPKNNITFVIPELLSKHGISLRELEASESVTFKGK